ncbi:hypothetical protein PSH03_002201 [Micromonospora sp. PSH03]|uniref:hypothetical protein n=1 Tax=Micromonospora TaxID=1873 RepID=UPI001EE84D74|nr:hypothetical protein [Micromonospora salmantinae]MCG5454205.1 hypothetical protein [Micromonospora salmantinae]
MPSASFESTVPKPGAAGNLVINPIVYAEVSVRFDRIEELDEALPAEDFLRSVLSAILHFLSRYKEHSAHFDDRKCKIEVGPVDHGVVVPVLTL